MTPREGWEDAHTSLFRMPPTQEPAENREEVAPNMYTADYRYTVMKRSKPRSQDTTERTCSATVPCVRVSEFAAARRGPSGYGEGPQRKGLGRWLRG